MKTLNRIKLWVLGFVLVASAASCDKTLDINKDPNNPSTSNPDLVLPSAQVGLGIALGNQWNYIGSMWGQYWTGGTVVSTAPLDLHTMVNQDVNASWTSAYARALADLKFLEKSGQPKYAGISKIMQAYTFQMLTDLFGDIPFEEAIQGAIEDGANLSPKYNTSEEVYAALIPLLDEGIELINTEGPGVVSPGSEDLIYGGDLAKWEAFANTLKLKVLVRQSTVSTTALDAALALINSGAQFIDESNGASIFFAGTSLGNSNPLWLRFDSRTATRMYYRASQASIDVLRDLGDSRIDGIYRRPGGNPANQHAGIIAGNANEPEYGTSSNNSFSEPNTTYVYGQRVPVFLLTPWESKFLQAEVLIRKNAGGDQALFEEGVKSSFNYFGRLSDADAYLTTLTYGESTTEKLKSLAIQKWISMNGIQMAEGWIETVRFDDATQTIFRGDKDAGAIFYSPTQNALGTNVYPSSFVYPTQEASLNPNAPARTTRDRRFWDN